MVNELMFVLFMAGLIVLGFILGFATAVILDLGIGVHNR